MMSLCVPTWQNRNFYYEFLVLINLQHPITITRAMFNIQLTASEQASASYNSLEDFTI